MRRSTILSTLAFVTSAGFAAGCNGGASGGEIDVAKPTGFREGISPGVRDNEKNAIVDSSVDYGLALRTAAMKLVGNYPTLAEIKAVQGAQNPPAEYAKIIDQYMARPAFAIEQVAFWRDNLKLGGQKTLTVNGAMVPVNMETAPNFAASLVVGEKPITQLVTADTGTCPSFDDKTGSFPAGNCAGPTVGILTDPGVQSQFYSAMAFRRLRWVQETFVCNKFPAEQGGKEQRAGGTYYSPWPFTSISGGPTARVDFQDDKSLICANCHSTMNHQAMLFAKYDEAGRLQNTIQVRTPIAGAPFSIETDWIPATEGLAWRYKKPVKDMKDYGRLIAEDPDFGRCMATRVWNWALSRGDAVVDQATLPEEMANQLAATLRENNYNMKKLIKEVFTSASFVRY